ncbi:MAG: hydrolase family protein [Herbinix sp.]|jgi:hypothetical protein|nr:hydrolase family protein [Herbinix sp.]
MSKIEYIEWCDFWIEDETNLEKPRVLLIGDSITRDYKGPVMELLQGEAVVNMMASSRGMDNEDYDTELGFLLNNKRFEYNAIHLNNGLHAHHLNADEYEKFYEQTIRFIRERSDAPIVVALSTPVYHDDTGYDHTDNERVIERNERVRRIAEHYDLIINDLYSLSYGKEEFRIGDGVHYNQTGSKSQAVKVVEALRNAMIQ